MVTGKKMDFPEYTELSLRARDMMRRGYSSFDVVISMINGSDGNEKVGIDEAKAAVAGAQKISDYIAAENENRALIDAEEMFNYIYTESKSWRWKINALDKRLKSMGYSRRGAGRYAVTDGKKDVSYPPELVEVLDKAAAMLEELKSAHDPEKQKKVGYFPPVPIGNIPGYAGVELEPEDVDEDHDDDVVDVEVIYEADGEDSDQHGGCDG